MSMRLFFDDLRAGATGAVLRDYQGTFIAASTTYTPNVSTAAMAEALAMRNGLAFANSLGYSTIEAESDSSDVIESCTGGETWWSEAAAIFADCVDYVASIGTVSLKHCPSKANRVAHVLARHSFSSKVSCNWVDEPPGFLLDALVNDATI